MTFSYDGFNRRITKTYQDHTDNTKSYAHHYLYDGENIVAILNSDKELQSTIVHHPTRTDTPLSITNHNTNQTYYYHRDHQGSIVALTNSEGKEIEHIIYDGHYGKILKHTKEEETLNPYGYTGRETDQEDLYYYRARYYDPTTQRFLSRDPIEFESGDFNFYRYVGNDPVNFVDPSGLLVQVLVWHKGPGGKDVGHTAVRINNSVYGYYPTDTNANNAYDMNELWSSKGDMHIDSLKDFHNTYKGETLDVFTLNATPEEEKVLQKYYESVNKNPGKYNLGNNQCTTVAIDGLKESGNINFLDALAISPDALRQNLKDSFNNPLLNNRFYNISGVSSISTIKADNL